MTDTDLLSLIRQLSKSDQRSVESFIEHLVLAHDKDHTLLTPQEKSTLDASLHDDTIIEHDTFKKELGL